MADQVSITTNITTGSSVTSDVTQGATITSSVVEGTNITSSVTAGGKGDPGEGVPSGGTTGQVLAKNSGTDYDTEWVTGSGGSGAVDSVNGQTGVVVLDTDDVSDSGATNKYVTAVEKTKLSNLSGTNTGDQDLSGYVPTTRTVNTKTLSSNITLNQDEVLDGTTYKQYSSTEKTKLAGIEAAADVTDTANVTAAGAFMKSVDDTDDITVGTTNKFATAAEKTKLSNITVTQAVDLDAIETNANNVPGIKTKTDFITVTQAVDLDTMESDIAGKQPLDSDLTSWASVTRASGFDTFAGTPSGANLASLLTTALPASKGGTGLTALAANVVSILSAVDYAAIRALLGLVIGTNVQAYDADLTTWAGITPGTGVGTFLATPSSANLAAAVTGETGSGALVFGTSPTLTTPALGTPSALTLTNATGLPVPSGLSATGTPSSTTYLRGDGTWSTPSGSGGTPGGSDTQIQFNDGGAFGGDSALIWDKTNNRMRIGGSNFPTNAKSFVITDRTTPATAAVAGGMLVDIDAGGGIYMTGDAGATQGKFEAYASTIGMGAMSAHPLQLFGGGASGFALSTGGIPIAGGSTVTTNAMTSRLAVIDTTSSAFTMGVNQFGTGTAGIAGFSSRGTQTSPTATQAGDIIMSITGRGWGSTVINTGSRGHLFIIANQNFTDTANGTYVQISSTPDNTITKLEVARWTSVASAVNYHQITNSATGSPITINAAGTDTNIGINLVPKGSGVAQANGVEIVTLTGSQTLTNKTLTSPAITTPTGIVKGDVGLGNVDNTSNATERAATATLTNKRVTPRIGTTTSSATPTINTDNVDYYSLTAQTVDITSFTTNLSGTPTDGQKLWISITGTAARAITWGASFEASTIALPVTTVTTARLDVGFIWNAATSKWRCVGTC